MSKLALLAMAIILLPMSAGQTNRLDAQDQAEREEPKVETPYPQIVRTIPEVGATGVKTSLRDIRIIFDRDMSGGMSWTGGPPEFPPTDERRKAKWINKRTCLLPVKLQKGQYYRVGINSKSYRNFKAADGTPAPPSAIYFATEGASRETMARAKRPEIAKLDPANGAKDIDPSRSSISVTFNMPMGGGMSWTGGGPEFPEIPEGKSPKWSADGTTCKLPVSLKSGQAYRLGLNSRSHNNFQSAAGVPLEPVVYVFQTR